MEPREINTIIEIMVISFAPMEKRTFKPPRLSLNLSLLLIQKNRLFWKKITLFVEF